MRPLLDPALLLILALALVVYRKVAIVIVLTLIIWGLLVGVTSVVPIGVAFSGMLSP